MELDIRLNSSVRGFTLKTFYFQDYINEIYNQRVKAKKNKDHVWILFTNYC
jgi:hypothetical protein